MRTIGCHLANRFVDLIEQRADLGRIVGVLIRQCLCHDHAAGSIDARRGKQVLKAASWIIPGADFGTTNHTRKQCLASVLIDPEVRKAADPGMANVRIGTLAY
jgi:hypothetical protein